MEKKKKKKKKYIVSRCILGVLLAGVIGSIVYVAVAVPDDLTFVSSKETKEPSQDSKSDNTESSLQESQTKQESQTTSNTEESKSEQNSTTEASSDTESIKINLNQTPTANSADMKKYIENYGFSFESMYCSQLIVVDTVDSNAKIYCFQKSDNGKWFNIIKEGSPLSDKAFISENGIAYNATDSNKCTPLGMYSLDEIFYIGQKPNTTYENLLEIKDTTYWVTDPTSKYYNMAADASEKDWKQAIKMADEPETYQYGVVIGFNTYSVDKTKGSAIFLQCGDKPTDGGISMPSETMKTIVEWLETSGSAFVLIL